MYQKQTRDHSDFRRGKGAVCLVIRSSITVDKTEQKTNEQKTFLNVIRKFEGDFYICVHIQYYNQTDN